MITLVWFLITVSAHGSITYSPPMKTIEECQRLQKIIPQQGSRCVELRVIK
jgi:hypothetical protein